jgi:hypothetical protein
MKTKRTLWLVALFAACNVMAQTPRQMQTTIKPVPAKTNFGSLNKLKVHWLAPAQPADWRKNQEPIEGYSPVAWTTIVGWHPGESPFPDDNPKFSTGMPVLWFGHEPWQ